MGMMPGQRGGGQQNYHPSNMLQDGTGAAYNHLSSKNGINAVASGNEMDYINR